MKLLVPVNGSKASLAAVRHAAHLARTRNDEIVLLNVQPRLNAHAGRFTSRAAQEGLRAERSALALAEAGALLRAAGIAFRSATAAGQVGARVVEVARALRVDQIVLGATRRAAWWQALFSPLPRILDRAEIPVIVIGEGRSGPFERYAVPACVGLGLGLMIAAE